MTTNSKSILLIIMLIISVSLFSCTAISQNDISFKFGELNYTIEQIEFSFLDMDNVGYISVLDIIDDMILLKAAHQYGLTMFLYDMSEEKVIAKVSEQDIIILSAVIFNDLIIYTGVDMLYGWGPRSRLYTVKSYDIVTGYQTIICTFFGPRPPGEPRLRRIEGGYLIMYVDWPLGKYVEFISYNQERQVLYSNNYERLELFSTWDSHVFDNKFVFIEPYQGNSYFFIGNTNGEYQRLPIPKHFIKHFDNFSILAQGIITSHVCPDNIPYLEFMSFDSQKTARLDGFRTFRKATNGNAILGVVDRGAEGRMYYLTAPLLITYTDEGLYAHIIDFHEVGNNTQFVAVDDNTWLIVLTHRIMSYQGLYQDIGVFRLRIL